MSSSSSTASPGLSRADCVALGRRLVENGLISYVARKRGTVFKDDYLLYQFNRVYHPALEAQSLRAGDALNGPRASPGSRSKIVAGLEVKKGSGSNGALKGTAGDGDPASSSVLARCRGRPRGVRTRA